MPWSQTILQQLTEQIRRPGRIKFAQNAPVDDAKKSFEKNFFSLASAIVQEQFPDLIKYSLGFQLLEKSPDNDWAVGIYVLRLKTLAFIPFIFDNGKVVGYDLLYLPKYDIFLPTTELWISYLKTKDIDVFDKEVDKEYEGLATSSFPNLLPLRRPVSFTPGGAVKFSSKGRYTVAVSRKTLQLLAPSLRLLRILKSSSLCRGLVVLLDRYPPLAKKIARKYSCDFLRAVLEKASEPDIVPIPKPKVEVYSELDCEFGVVPDVLVDAIQKRGYVIVDNRDDEETTNKVIRSPVNFSSFQVLNPGFYKTIVNDPFTIETGYVIEGVVANRSLERYWFFIPENGDVLYRTVQDSKYSMNSAPYVLAHVSREQNFPRGFKKVTQTLIDALNGDKKALDDYQKNGNGTSYLLILDRKGNALCLPQLYFGCDHLQFVLTDKPSIRIQRSRALDDPSYIVFIPNDAVYKVFKEVQDWKQPSLLSVHEHLKEAGYRQIKLAHFRDQDQYAVNDKLCNKLEAVVYLMKEFGLREAVAEKLLKQAFIHGKQIFFVKRALKDEDQPSVWFPSTYATAEFAPGYKAHGSISVDYIVPGLKRPKPVINILEPPPERVFQTLKKLDEINNGEIFDAALISSILHTTRDENLIDVYIPKIIGGIDAIGRILFALYVHRDKLKERYDEADYNKLIDNCKTALELVGDLVMDLSQRNIDEYINELSESEEEQ